MTKVVVFGAGHTARMMKAYLEREGREIAGFAVNEAFLAERELEGLPVFPWERLEEHLPPGTAEILGPVSHLEMNDLRRRRHAEARARGYGLASFIHPTAQIYARRLGEASIILEYAIIQPGTTVGDGVIAWSGTLIGHDCEIGDYCFLSGSVSVGGRTRIGDGCYLAGAVKIKPGTIIGEEAALLNACHIGSDIPARGVVKGRGDFPLRVTSDRIHKLL